MLVARTTEPTNYLPLEYEEVTAVAYDSTKRILDVFGSLMLITLLGPIMLGVATAVKMTSPGRVIFRQRRLTQAGRVFEMFKFRTMRSDAERETGAVFAESEDPRITLIGKFLRKTRLDELPQLFNVLRGDMSLIGPRPERPEMAEKLARQLPGFNRRLEVKAGLTGLAQVSSGYAANLRGCKKKLALDVIYIENRSLMLDLRIALKTVIVVLSGDGAR